MESKKTLAQSETEKPDKGNASVIVDAAGIKKYYTMGNSFAGKRNKTLKAVNGVSLRVHEGEIFGVVGESGCGKSTLGRALLRLFPLTEGRLLFEGKDLSSLGRRELKPYRPRMQMVFQNPYSSFDQRQRLGDALAEAGKVCGLSRENTDARIKELMEVIRLPDEMLERRPQELSGGQLQRLAFARALLPAPRFIVADEPVSALDVSVQAQILNLIIDLKKQMKLTMLFISHEMTVVEHICDTIGVMYLGEIVEIAPAGELFSHPAHPYTQALLSSIPKTHPDEEKERIVLSGELPSAIDLPKGCAFAGRCRYATAVCREKKPEAVKISPGHHAACHLYQAG